MELARSAGVLLHITSLPGPHGMGDLGSSAFEFVDWLVQAKQSWWQVLPLGPVSADASPFNSPSSWAGNPYLISLAELVKAGDLKTSDLAGLKGADSNRVNFADLIPEKNRLLVTAARNFLARSRRAAHRKFSEFCRREKSWLDNWVLFAAVHRHFGDRLWLEWPSDLVSRRPAALRAASKEFAEALQIEAYLQYRFYEQWQNVKSYANRAGIKIIGDLPIYCGLDSADVWANRELFQVDRLGRPLRIAGCPPDAFSKTGQLWGAPLGIPVYNWKRHEAQKYEWWLKRFEAGFRMADVLRIDHFRGLAGYWAIPGGSQTAVSGRWEKGPGDKFFSAVSKRFGRAPFIAEDLGRITPDVVELRDKWQLPGMRVLQFAFGGNPRNTHLPFWHVPHSVVYTSTHDNDTALGWYTKTSSGQRKFFSEMTGSTGRTPHLDLIRYQFGSVAKLAIVAIQDLLGLDSSARMNIPGQEQGNWGFKLKRGQLKTAHADQLADLTEKFARSPQKT